MKTKHNRNKWINIFICFVMIFVCLGFCSANKSLFLAAICDALDLKRTVFSLSTSCRYLTSAAVNFFFGYLVAKHGTKKLISTGFIFLIMSMCLSSVAADVRLFYLSEVFAGIGFSLTGTAMVGCVVTRWSPENKGTIMGAVLCANGVGGAIAAQIISPMIYNEHNIFGYRNAYRFIAVLLVITLIGVLIFFKDKPEGETTPPPAGKSRKPKSQSWSGIEFDIIKRKPCFYAALICIFFTGFCIQGVVGIFAAHMHDVGLDAAFVANMSSITFIVLSASKFVTGVMYDKVGLRITITMCCIAAIICMVSLALTSNSAAGRIFAVCYAFFAPIAFPLETVMLPLYSADLFGEKSFDKVMGIFVSANTAGYAIGTPLANLGFDITGSYVSILVITAAMMLCVVVTMQFVITAAHKLRNQ